MDSGSGDVVGQREPDTDVVWPEFLVSFSEFGWSQFKDAPVAPKKSKLLNVNVINDYFTGAHQIFFLNISDEFVVSITV